MSAWIKGLKIFTRDTAEEGWAIFDRFNEMEAYHWPDGGDIRGREG